MRLDKFISESTAYSRKDIKALIKKELITVNGIIASKPEEKVKETDIIIVSGKKIEYKKYVYLMLNKPPGYISATEDRHLKVVTELVPEEYSHFNVFPVGRLDIDTEGLLLMTNDGVFDHAVTSPRKNIYKKYFVRLDKECEEADIELFSAGMRFKDFTAKPAKLQICDNKKEAYVEIAEGKFHQVKRMFERAGKKVVYLKRVAIGGLELDETLGLGDVKELEYNKLISDLYGKGD